MWHPDKAAAAGRIDVVQSIWTERNCRPSWYGMDQAMIHGEWEMVEYLMKTFSTSCSSIGLSFLLNFSSMSTYHTYIRYFVLTQYASSLAVLEPSLLKQILRLAEECYDVHVIFLLSNAVRNHEPWTYEQVMSEPTLYTVFMNHQLEFIQQANRECGFNVPTHWVIEYLSTPKCVHESKTSATIAMLREIHNYHGTLTGACAKVAARMGLVRLRDMFVRWRYFFQLSEDANLNERKAYESQQEYIRLSVLGVVTEKDLIKRELLKTKKGTDCDIKIASVMEKGRETRQGGKLAVQEPLRVASVASCSA